MSIFYDIYQNTQISGAEVRAQRSEAKAEDAKEAVEQLEERVNRLTLINMALWSLLKEITNLTEEDLVKRVEEIDLQDGYIDGRTRPKIASCDQCGQTLSQKHQRCLHCGWEPQVQGAFDKVAR